MPAQIKLTFLYLHRAHLSDGIQACLDVIQEDIKVHQVSDDDSEPILCFMNGMDSDEQEKALAQKVLAEYLTIRSGDFSKLDEEYDEFTDTFTLWYSDALLMIEEVK